MVRRYNLSIASSMDILGSTLRVEQEDTLTDSNILVSSSIKSKYIYQIKPCIILAYEGEKIVLNVENRYSKRPTRIILKSHSITSSSDKELVNIGLKNNQSFTRAIRCQTEGVFTLRGTTGPKKDGRYSENIVGAVVVLSKDSAQKLTLPSQSWFQRVTSHNAGVIGWFSQYAGINWSSSTSQTKLPMSAKLPSGRNTRNPFDYIPKLKQYGAFAGLKGAISRLIIPVSPEKGAKAIDDEHKGKPTETASPPDVALVNRHLTAQTQGHVKLAETFSLIVQVSTVALASGLGVGSASIKGFVGKLEVDVIASGFQILNGSIQTLEVPAVGDSVPIRFLLRAEQEGRQSISVTAYNGAAYITGLKVEVNVGDPMGIKTNAPDPVVSPIVMRQPEPEEGMLIVNFDETQKRYCFRFRFGVKESPLMYSASMLGAKQDVINSITDSLNGQARNLKGFSNDQAQAYMQGLGANLYRELIPNELKQALWQAKGTMKSLNIISPADTMPWEILYVSHPETELEGTFLADFTTVVRWFNGSAVAPAQLQRAPAYVVIPPGAPSKASLEFAWVFAACGEAELINDLDKLLTLTQAGKFHWLHFAAHNEAPITGIATSYVPFGQGSPSFELMFMGRIAANTYSSHQPLVFMNACTSATSQPLFTEMVGWADSFVRCGAAAFIGSFWQVRDESAAKFAQAFYESLKAGNDLGQAMASGRQALDVGDPTYLAYTLYGNPSALLR